jgi:membrane-bound ClpP family serine protease
LKIGSFSVRWIALYLVGVVTSVTAIFLGHSFTGSVLIWLGVVVMLAGLVMLWNEYMERWWTPHDDD